MMDRHAADENRGGLNTKSGVWRRCGKSMQFMCMQESMKQACVRGWHGKGGRRPEETVAEGKPFFLSTYYKIYGCLGGNKAGKGGWWGVVV